MKVWGIIATILLVAAIGLGGWFYVQNKSLKSDKSKLETDLSAAKASKAQADTKMASANKKIGVLTLFFSGATDTDTMNQAYNLIKEINNETLTADYKAMQNSKPGDTSGNKMMQDLLSTAAADLK